MFGQKPTMKSRACNPKNIVSVTYFSQIHIHVYIKLILSHICCFIIGNVYGEDKIFLSYFLEHFVCIVDVCVFILLIFLHN